MIREQSTVMLVVPTGRSARVLLRPQLISPMSESGIRVVVLSPPSLINRFKEEFDQPGITFAPASPEECGSYHRFGIRGWCALVRRCAANGECDLATLNNRLAETKRQLHQRGIVKAGLVSLAVTCLRQSSWLRHLWLQLETRFFVGNFHKHVLDTFQPNLIAFSTPGYDSPIETEVLREAYHRNIKTAVVVRGWDNPSAKGMMAAMPDYFLAWTETMKRELVEYHGVVTTAVTVTGAPYLDSYNGNSPIPSRNEFIENLNLDCSRKVIAFATKPPGSYPWNLDVIKALAEAIRDNRFGVPCQLVVRLYPVDETSTLEVAEHDECQKLAQSFPHVYINQPNRSIRKSEPRENENEAASLRSILKHADVLVNIYSTMAIEAALNDLPVVTIRYNGRTGTSESSPVNHSRSVQLHATETHNQRLASHGGISVAHSEEEVISLVREYLNNRARDADGRRRIVEYEVGPNHGKAGRVVGQVLASLATSQTRSSDGS